MHKLRMLRVKLEQTFHMKYNITQQLNLLKAISV